MLEKHGCHVKKELKSEFYYSSTLGEKGLVRLCRDPPELGADNCILHPRVTRQPPAHNCWCCTSHGNKGHDPLGAEFLAFAV